MGHDRRAIRFCGDVDGQHAYGRVSVLVKGFSVVMVMFNGHSFFVKRDDVFVIEKNFPETIILCLALKGKCVLALLQLVSLIYQVGQYAMLSLWHHLAALLGSLLRTGEQLYNAMKYKLNGLCNLSPQ